MRKNQVADEIVNPLETLALLYADYQAGPGTEAFEDYIDTRFEDSFDIIGRAAIQNFAGSAARGQQTIQGVVLRTDDPEISSQRQVGIPDDTGPSTELYKLHDLAQRTLGLGTTATIAGARIMPIGAPGILAHLPIPESYDGTWDDIAIIDNYPIFLYSPESMPLVPGSFIRGTFDPRSFRSGIVIEQLPVEPYLFPELLADLPTDKDWGGSVSAGTLTHLGATGGRPEDCMTNVFTGARVCASEAGFLPDGFVTTTPRDIFDAASCYDLRNDIPNKDQHARWLEEMHPDFLPYAKIFICRCWDYNGVKLTLNSAFRTVAYQKALRAQWVKRTGAADAYRDQWIKDRVTDGMPLEEATRLGGAARKAWIMEKPGSRKPGGEPARGLSWHNTGWAIDFNPWTPEKVDEEGNTTKAKKICRTCEHPSTWFDTLGIPQVAASLNLRWGGYFGKRSGPRGTSFGQRSWDPIHVDGGHILPALGITLSAHVLSAEKAGVQPNRYPLGGLDQGVAQTYPVGVHGRGYGLATAPGTPEITPTPWERPDVLDTSIMTAEEYLETLP